MVDSGSTHSFLSEQFAAQLPNWKLLQNPVPIKVTDGGIILCTHEIVGCDWLVQGTQFSTTFKILPLKCYDVILGMDWLASHSPMHVQWAQIWLSFNYQGRSIKIQGVNNSDHHYLQISGSQLNAMKKLEDVWCEVCLYAVETQDKMELLLPQIQVIVDQYPELFAEPTGVPPTRSMTHSIPLLPGTRPFRLRPYRYTPFQKDEIEKQVAHLLKNNMIQVSTSPFASPVLLVKKKTGEWRLCVDFRRLNAYTIKNKFPLSIIEELFEELIGAKWFTTLDLRSGFHQILVKQEDQYKTAFQTHFGHFEYKVMPYGLTGAPTTFQAIMNHILVPLLRKCVVVFIDDILIYSKNIEDHKKHLKLVFDLLRQHQFKVRMSKCSFAKQQLNYLGHVISSEGVATYPKKIADVENWPVPSSVKEVRSFLGLTGYYRRFVQNFGLIAKPLTELLKKGKIFVWTPTTEQDFQALKTALITSPVLALPNFELPFVVETDTSDKGIGAVLQQNGHPIAYVNGALGPKNHGLSTYEKESLAILMAVDHWRAYLQSSEFIIQTDQRNLVHLDYQRLNTYWQQKALTKLMGLKYKIYYKKGTANNATDALSRVTHASTSELLAISTAQPVWLQDLQNSYDQNAIAKNLLTELAIKPVFGNFKLVQGIIKHKDKIWLGHD